MDDLAPVGERVSARDAMADLRVRGLGEVCSGDLEVYQLVMSPAEFKRLCARLDRAIAEHAETQHRAGWSNEGLPFGDDLQEAADRERRRQWADRPNGEPLPRCWTVEETCQVPGRLKLVEGREFTATGIRGRLRFHRAVRTTDGEFWIDAYDIDGRYRSLRPERVKRVHSKSKLHPRRAGRR